MASTTSQPALLRIDEVARHLAISRATTYRLIQRGVIPTVHIGGVIRIPSAALDRWLETQLRDSAEPRQER